MIDFSSLDRRSRTLVILAGATIAMTLLALVMISANMRERRADFAPRPFLPKLAAQLDKVASVSVSKGTTTITATRQPDDGWVIADKGNFPADVRPLRQIFEGLRDLRAIAPKTDNPKWHETLALTAPGEDGTGTRVTLERADGSVITSLIVGKRAEAGRVGERQRLYMRKDGEDQTWLVSGVLAPETDVSDWLDIAPFTVEASEVREVVVRETPDTTYVLQKAAPGERDFALEPVPEGRKPVGRYALSTVARALGGLPVEDVKARDDFPADDTLPRVTYRTFDGLVLTVTVHKSDEAAWLAFEAAAEPPFVPAGTTDEPAAERAPAAPGEAVLARVTAINALAERFVVQVPSYKANEIAKPLDDLLAPVEETPLVPGAGQ